jgi:hypothetical protein
MFLWALFTIILAVLLFIAWSTFKLIIKGIALPINFLVNKHLKSIEVAEKNAILERIFESYGKAYEYTCILHPKEFEGKVTEILANYKSLLNGKILDPDMKHAPSEKLYDKDLKEDVPNEDYLTYLEAQVKTLKKADRPISEHMTSELKKTRKLFKETRLLLDFRMELLEQGLSAQYLEPAVTPERIQKYKPSDWKELIDAIVFYESIFEWTSIAKFLETITDKKSLLDVDKMRTFHILYSMEDIDPYLIKCYIEEGHNEDIVDIVQELEDIKDGDSVPPNEAFNILMDRMGRTKEEEELRSKYNKAVRV